MITQQLRQPGAVLRRRGARLLSLGAALTALGALVSLTTLLAASAEGGTMVIALGPLLCGIALMVGGTASLLRARGEASAGWHVDPTGRHGRRYWDGVRWTERVTDGGREVVDPPEAI